MKGGKSAVPYRGMVQTALGIVREEGPLQLFYGLSPAVLRHIVYSGVRMGAYEHIRENVLGRDASGGFPLWKAVLAGGSAGAIGELQSMS